MNILTQEAVAIQEEAAQRQLKSRRGEPTWELANFFPRQGDWTEKAYLALDTNWLIELSDGCLEFLPMPTIFHQLIVQFLFRILDGFVRAQGSGCVLIAPLPVRLWEGKYREPDLIFLRSGRIHNVHSQPRGADLVMEVVSPGEESRKRDLEIKREEYAEAGIDEYWIIDPERQTITVLKRNGNAYREHGVFAPATQAASVALPGFAVDVTAAFAAGNTFR